MARPFQLFVAVLALVALASACADSGSVDAGQTASTAGADSPTTAPGATEASAFAVACGQVRFEDRTMDVSALTPFTDDLSTYVGEEAAPEFDASGGFADVDFYEVERTSTRLVLFGIQNPAPTEPDASPYVNATFGQVDGQWRAEGWGGCRLTVDAPGYGVAELALDPAAETNEATTSLKLLATERNCASGQAPDGREIVPVVTETDSTIEIVVLVEPVSGGAECPGNPAFRVAVELDRPVGDRRILDLAFEPSTEIDPAAAVRPPQLNIVVAGQRPPDGRANTFLWTATESESAAGGTGGGLLISSSAWEEEPGWIQSFDGVETRTITAFVAGCGAEGCEEECVAEGCDAYRSADGACELTYERNDEVDTTFTITYGPAADGASCSIEASVEPIGA